MELNVLPYDEWPPGTPDAVVQSGPPNAPVSRDTYERLLQLPGWKIEWFNGVIVPEPRTWPLVLRYDGSPLVRRSGIELQSSNDLDRLSELASEAFPVGHVDVWGLSDDERRHKLRLGIEDVLYARRDPFLDSLVATRQGKDIGLVLVRQGEQGAVLETLGTVVGARRSGVASTLLAGVIERNGQQPVFSSTLRANRASIVWHHAVGFTELPDPATMRLRQFEVRARIGDAEGTDQIATAIEAYWSAACAARATTGKRSPIHMV